MQNLSLALPGILASSNSVQSTICTQTLTTPLGPMLGAVRDNHLCLLEFSDQEIPHSQMDRLQQLMEGVASSGNHELFETLQNQLDEYFNHQRRQFDIPLETAGTEFQRSAWIFLQSIPYAQTRSYQQQAGSLGKPAAARAVGHANGLNAIAILIPCHRVIAKNGSLAGYAGGVWRKKFLLNHEQTGHLPL